eukprot:9447793-Prorocentrum_lima.AAC.1
MSLWDALGLAFVRSLVVFVAFGCWVEVRGCLSRFLLWRRVCFSWSVGEAVPFLGLLSGFAGLVP